MSVRFSEDLQVRSIRTRIVSNAEEDLIDQVLPLSPPSGTSNSPEAFVDAVEPDAEDAVPQDGAHTDAAASSITPPAPAFQFVHSSSRSARALMFFAVALFTFAIYHRTLYHSVMGGDSGELLAAGCEGGTGHPPGYPLFMMATYLLHRLHYWQDNTATKMAYFCAGCTSLAAGMLSLTALRLSGSVIFSTMAACLYAFSPLIWQNAVQAEVFSINNFFVCSLLYVTVCFADNRKRSTAFIGASVVGLGLCNQHTLIFFAAPCIISVCIYGWPWVFRPLNVLFFGVIFFGSLLPYMQWFSIYHMDPKPRYSWGNYDSWEGFFKHLLRQEYGSFNLAVEGAFDHGDPQSFFFQCREYLTDLVLKQSLFIFGLAAIAIVPITLFCAIFRRQSASQRHPGIIVLVVTWCFYICVYNGLANLPISHPLFYGVNTRFWLQPNAIAFVLCAVACTKIRNAISHVVLRFMEGVSPVSRDDDALLWCLQQTRFRTALAHFVVALAAAYAVAVQLRTNWNFQDYSEQHMIDILARTALQSAPPNALLLASGDMQFGPTMYLNLCEGVRPDVLVMSQQLMSYEWYADYDRERRWPGVVFPARHHYAGPHGYSMQKFLEANLRPNRPIVLWGGTRPGELAAQTNDASLSEEEFTAFPLGLLDQVYWQVGLGAHPTPPPLSQRIQAHIKAARPLVQFFEEGRQPNLRFFDKTTWEEFGSGEYWLMHHRFGYKMIFLAQSIEAAVASGDESELDDLALAWLHAEKNYAFCLEGLRSTREMGVPDVMGHTSMIFQNLGLATQYRAENVENGTVADALQRHEASP